MFPLTRKVWNFVRRVLRVVIPIFLVWLFLAIIWVALPFPQYSADEVSQQLNDGKQVIRVYTWDGLGHMSSRTSILTYKLHDADSSEERWLEFGGGKDPLSNIYPGLLTLPLTNANLTLHIPNKTLPISVSPAYEVVTPYNLHYYGPFRGWNMPWFAVADAALFDWWVDHSSEQLRYRIRTIPKDNILEIWRDTQWWTDFPRPPPTETPPNMSPILTIRLQDDKSPEFSFGTRPHSQSPSTFYRFRLALFFILLPLTLLGMGVFALLFWGSVSVFIFLTDVTSSVLLLWLNFLALACCARITYWFYSRFRSGDGERSQFSRDMESVRNWYRGLWQRGNHANVNGEPQGDLEAGVASEEGGISTNKGKLADNTHRQSEGVLVDVSEPAAGSSVSDTRP